MREVEVRAVVTDPWDSPVKQIIVSWHDYGTGRTYGARVPLTEDLPEPLPKPPPPDPIKVKFPDLTDEDVRWLRSHMSVANGPSTPTLET